MSSRSRLYLACLFTVGSLACSGRAARMPEPQGTLAVSLPCGKCSGTGKPARAA